MKIYNKIYSLAIVIALIATSCQEFVEEGFNDDPNSVQEVPLRSLLPTIIESTADTHYRIAFTTSEVTQQMYNVVRADVSEHQTFNSDGAWTEAYLLAMTNADILIKQAVDEGVPNYAGIAQVLMAMNLGLVTDTWENAPYSQAFQGFDIPQPVYDSQESLYDQITILLDDALINLSEPAVEFLEPSDDDLVYKGAISNWIKLANGLKARYSIHLSNKGEATAVNAALAAIANALSSNKDDFQLVYNAINRNPWHLRPVLADNTGNNSIAPGAYLVNNMNGTNFPFSTISEDPRLSGVILGYPSSASAATGNTLSGTSGNAFVDETTFYTRESAPVVMMSYAELKFIEAESYLILEEAANAYDAYLDGIEANMMKVGVSASDMASYLADPSVAVGSGNLTVALIMKEKYIALFLNPEVWVDMRRYGYSTSVYPNLTEPPAELKGPEVPIGLFPQRALYPQDELSRNSANANAAFEAFATPMWRDQ